MEAISSEDLRGYTLNIYRDPDPTSPDENADEHAFLVYQHRDFTVEGPNKETAQKVFENREEWEKTHFLYPVYAYIHSGVHLGLSTAGMVDMQWDVSTTGFIVITRDESEVPKPEEHAQAMIDEWNNYLSGEVYGYQVENGDGEAVESCWGYYDLEYCKTEGRLAVPEEPFIPAPKPITCFDDRELNTVLHSLRLYQDYKRYGREQSCNAQTGCDHFDEVEPLTVEEIEALCERMQLRPAKATVQNPDNGK